MVTSTKPRCWAWWDEMLVIENRNWRKYSIHDENEAVVWTFHENCQLEMTKNDMIPLWTHRCVYFWRLQCFALASAISVSANKIAVMLSTTLLPSSSHHLPVLPIHTRGIDSSVFMVPLMKDSTAMKGSTRPFCLPSGFLLGSPFMPLRKSPSAIYAITCSLLHEVVESGGNCPRKPRRPPPGF